ncbi:MAG: hypothetical protein RI885_1254 [Actinomycetota bacterium]|jgi:transcriptional regulator GlxA family with amidase domain
MHRVVVIAYPGVLLFDLAVPIEVFGRVELPDGRLGYEVEVCGTAGGIPAAGAELSTRRGLEALASADTVIVPGADDPEASVPDEVLVALQASAEHGARIASICVGAFTLAAAGLLEGRRATTHWRAADLFRRRHPEIDLDPTVLFVDTGQILTSAGATAGIDLCLHMVGSDYGAAVAAEAARSAVVALHRDGGQKQFIRAHPIPGSSAPLSELIGWLEENAHRDLTLDQIAGHASMSIRTVNRRFHAHLGTTPLRWLTDLRVRRAQGMLETTAHSIELVARHSGFSSTAYFRIQFKRATGVTPQQYRGRFRTAPATAS